MSSSLELISKLKSRYITLRFIETVLLAFSAALISFCPLFFLINNLVIQLTLSIVISILILLVRIYQLRLFKITEHDIAVYLNTNYSQFEGSLDLILVKDELPLLPTIQKTKAAEKLETLKKEIAFPHRIKFFILLFMGSLIAVWIISFAIPGSLRDKTQSLEQDANQETILLENLPAEIKEASINVSPPTYTQIDSYGVPNLNLTVQENSLVAWSLKFSGTIKTAGLINASGDTSHFVLNNNVWKLSLRLDRNGFYRFIWKDVIWHASDYYKIEIIKDQPPVIQLNNLDQFIQIAHTSNQSIEVRPTLRDDYGLTDTYIIATVSKGSGESVKFREEKIRFSSPQKIIGKELNASQTLNLKKLGMEPGDELYFYVEVFDNKTPVQNRTRTETYFVSIPDTTQDVMSADGGLGVDLMPEYFRSQRQIIIDTEKLMRDKKSITKKEFDSRSNELGSDQKVLRLRYGQFLGEEAESGIGPVEQHAEEDHEENEKPEDMIKSFGHQHDTENEHNLVEEKNPAKKDVDGEKKEDPLAAFAHQHDNEESATFFYQSLKLKLKAALAQMWDAELYLRLNQPDKSLPYQYIALRLLKEISNDSRIYVHRTGFEPPPIKEEKRLSADLNELFNSDLTYEVAVKKYFPGISKALEVTEELIASQATRLNKKEKEVLLQSSQELAQAALENPSLLPGLSALKQVTESDVISTDILKTLQKSYWQALPKKSAQASKHNSALHTLDHEFIEQLEFYKP